MITINFSVNDQIDYRDDDSNYEYYLVRYLQQFYYMAYYKGNLIEVYVMKYENQFFRGFRLDTKVVSDYYTHEYDKGYEINKYEDNILKCIYYTTKDNPDITWTYKNGKKVIYKTERKEVSDLKKRKLYYDLRAFLKYSTKKYIHFRIPKEPKNNMDNALVAQ